MQKESAIVRTLIFFVCKYDNFLKWNASEYDNINQLYLKSSRIWTPDIIIMDSAEEKQLQRSQSDKYMLIVSSTGKIRWHYQTLSKSLCDIDRKPIDCFVSD